MDILSTILPVYDALEKQERYKKVEQVTRICPQNQLLPFLCKRAHSTSNTELTSIKLVDCSGTETEIRSYFKSLAYAATSWTNGPGTPAGYSTAFSSSGMIINAAVDPDGTAYAYTNTFGVTTGDKVLVEYTLTVTSGQVPSMRLCDSAGTTARSNLEALVAGTNAVLLTATITAADLRLEIYNSVACNFALTVHSVSKSNRPVLIQKTAVDYFQYNGAYLSNILPLGRYYLKMTDGANYFYSEFFEVRSIYTSQCTAWTNSGATPFETLTTSGATIASAINSSTSGRCYANAITCANGEVFKVVFYLTLVSGDLPTLAGYESPGAADIVTGEATCTSGLNEVTLTCTKSSLLTIGFNVATASSFSTGPVYIFRAGADNHVKFSFTNTLDLSDILYASSFTQLFFAEGYLKNVPSQKNTEGDLRDGVLILEKSVIGPKYQVMHAVSPLLMHALESLEQHTTLTVTSTMGIAYTAHNVAVEASEETYDVNKILITFTANERVWTLNQTNIA